MAEEKNYSDASDDPALKSSGSTTASSAPPPNPAVSDVSSQPQVDAEEDRRRREEIEKEAALANKIRLNEQAALLMNIDLLRESIAAKDTTARKDKLYNNFCLFKGKGRDGHIELTKFLYKNPSNANFFDQVNNKMLSFLMPHIKLYKTFYPNEAATRRPHTECFMWRIPFDDIATEYGSETSKILETFYGDDKNSSKSYGVLEEIMAGRGRMHGIGIKSFRYKYQGTNPAEINTNIEAELELYFQDLRDLLKTIEIDKNDPNFLETSVKPNRTFSFCYADLVADTARVNKDKQTGKSVYNPEYFRLQAVIGYAPLSPSAFNTLDESEISILKNVIDNSRTILYLTPYKHDLQFQDNGTATLKITYSAALTSTMANINVLGITKLHDKVKQLEEKLDRERAGYSEEIDKIKKAPGLTQTEVEKHIEGVKKQTEIALKIAEERVDNAKNEVYSEVFKRLVGLEKNRSGPNNGKVYSVLLNKEALGVNDPKSKKEDAKKIDSYKMDSLSSTDKDSRVASSPDKIKKTGKTSSSADQTASTATDREDQRTEYNVSNGKYLVKFVFLGDILDILCESTQEVGPLEKPRIILNDVTVNIPRLVSKAAASETGNQHNSVVEPQNYQINIADIPISVNLLQQFFFEKIIKKRLQNYPLNILLSDLISAIITPATSPKIVGKATIKKSLRISTTHICLPFIDNDSDSITSKPIGQPFSGLLTPEVLQASPPYENLKTQGLFGSYLIFYSSNHTPDILKKEGGSDAKDTNLGIYKLQIGTDTGMVKSINFSRTDQPFRREAKVLGSQGETNILRLKEVYDSTIKMFGNNFFRPGDFIYIEPMFFSGKSAIDIQDRLGIGGYYQVIDVDNSINNGVFETSLKTVFQAWRDPKNNDTVYGSDGE